MMEVQGKIIAVLPLNRGVSQRTGTPWCAQTFVLETAGQYPKKIPFEVFGEDRLRQFNIQMGETVTISFDIEGREWNGKWFTKISCYNLTKNVSQQAIQQPATPVPPPSQPPSPIPNNVAPASPPQQEGGVDDIPF